MSTALCLLLGSSLWAPFSSCRAPTRSALRRRGRAWASSGALLPMVHGRKVEQAAARTTLRPGPAQPAGQPKRAGSRSRWHWRLARWQRGCLLLRCARPESRTLLHRPPPHHHRCVLCRGPPTSWSRCRRDARRIGRLASAAAPRPAPRPIGLRLRRVRPSPPPSPACLPCSFISNLHYNVTEADIKVGAGWCSVLGGPLARRLIVCLALPVPAIRRSGVPPARQPVRASIRPPCVLTPCALVPLAWACRSCLRRWARL